MTTGVIGNTVPLWRPVGLAVVVVCFVGAPACCQQAEIWAQRLALHRQLHLDYTAVVGTHHYRIEVASTELLENVLNQCLADLLQSSLDKQENRTDPHRQLEETFEGAPGFTWSFSGSEEWNYQVRGASNSLVAWEPRRGELIKSCSECSWEQTPQKVVLTPPSGAAQLEWLGLQLGLFVPGFFDHELAVLDRIDAATTEVQTQWESNSRVITCWLRPRLHKGLPDEVVSVLAVSDGSQIPLYRTRWLSLPPGKGESLLRVGLGQHYSDTGVCTNLTLETVRVLGSPPHWSKPPVAQILLGRPLLDYRNGQPSERILGAPPVLSDTWFPGLPTVAGEL